MPNVSEADEHFWATVSDRSATNEADVEAWFVLPLLEALGHDRLNIASKVAILFQEGRQRHPGRKPEADFVVYAERPFCRSTSLIVVESKRASESLDGGKEQGESYAFNLRAPILLLTNGRQIEIWQLRPTLDSERVLACDVVDLPQYRGQLEGLLSVEAVKDFCKGLEHKNFDLLARDLSAYEQAVYERVKPLATEAVPRRLKDRDTQHEWQSNGLLNLPGRGAVITAASGYGKTVLASLLMYESIELRWGGLSEALPIDIFLPDFAQSEQRLEEFLTERITAHKPGFSDARLKDVARAGGLVLIADGFERIELSKRPKVEGQLRTLLADFPRVRVYLMSRAQAAPMQLGLSCLELQSYQPQELRELATLRLGEQYGLSGAPDYVYRLGEVPLIADQVLEHYRQTGSYPSNLSALFEKWLSRIVDASGVVDRALDRLLLEEIAVETVSRPLDIGQACELSANRPDPLGTIRRLADQDAVSIQGTTVELQHEALADYLRAKQFWASSAVPNPSRLDVLAFDPSSLFAFLLLSAAPTADARSAAWEVIARRDIRLAIRSLRFAGFDTPFTGEVTHADGWRLASDLQSAIEALIVSHLEPIGAAMRERIAGRPVEKLGIKAGIGKDGISYSFFDAAGVDEPVVLERAGEMELAPRMYGHALRRLGLGPEAGRVLGVERVKSAVEELIKDRSLSGGLVWTEERAFGRLRHLAHRYDTPLEPTDFAQALRLLEPLAGQWVGGSSLDHGQSFAIDELLADLRCLQEQGINYLDRWWSDLDTLNVREPEDQQFLARTLNAYYRRRQLAYHEITERSLPALCPYLRTARLMPFRMEIVAKHFVRGSREDVGLLTLRWPVRNFDEAGADVTFSNEQPDYFNEEAMQVYVERTDRLLSEFGRFFPDRVVEWSDGRVPDLKGWDTTFGALPDESAVVSGAMAWLREDLEKLFDDMPSGRWQS